MSYFYVKALANSSGYSELQRKMAKLTAEERAWHIDRQIEFAHKEAECSSRLSLLAHFTHAILDGLVKHIAVGIFAKLLGDNAFIRRTVDRSVAECSDHVASAAIDCATPFEIGIKSRATFAQHNQVMEQLYISHLSEQSKRIDDAIRDERHNLRTIMDSYHQAASAAVRA